MYFWHSIHFLRNISKDIKSQKRLPKPLLMGIEFIIWQLYQAELTGYMLKTHNPNNKSNISSYQYFSIIYIILFMKP